MIARLATGAWIALVWLVATESLTVTGAITGVAVAVVLTTLFRPDRVDSGRSTFHPVAAVVALGYFLMRLAQANVHVAKAVIAPGRVGLRRAIVAIPVVPCPETILWLLANAVSLTPGTTIVDLRRDPPTFYVHVLLLTSVDGARLDVARLQRHLVAALGRAELLDEVDRHLNRLVAGRAGPTGEEVHP
jgi:multicomponent Na+:H+ antiporter subunit E